MTLSAAAATDLLARYDRPGPRYTAYPTAVEFHDGFGVQAYLRRLEQAAQRPEAPLALYVHLPFCAERVARRIVTRPPVARAA